MNKKVLSLALVALIAALLTVTASAQLCELDESEASCLARGEDLSVEEVCARACSTHRCGTCTTSSRCCSDG